MCQLFWQWFHYSRHQLMLINSKIFCLIVLIHLIGHAIADWTMIIQYKYTFLRRYFGILSFLLWTTWYFICKTHIAELDLIIIHLRSHLNKANWFQWAFATTAGVDLNIKSCVKFNICFLIENPGRRQLWRLMSTPQNMSATKSYITYFKTSYVIKCWQNSLKVHRTYFF